MRVVGTLYIVAGVLNLIGLANPELREQIISVAAVITRYSFYVFFGIGMVMLRRWSAYVFAAGILVNWILFLTIYGGESAFLWYISLVGPVLIGGLYYYAWPVLLPSSPTDQKEQRDA